MAGSLASDRFAFALRLPETGLCIRLPEKNPDSDRIRCRTVRSPQPGLSGNNREIRAYFAHLRGNRGGGNSLQSRLRGGEEGIRTPDTLSGMPVFKTGAINHSATSPGTTVLLQFHGLALLKTECPGMKLNDLGEVGQEVGE